MSEIDNIPTTDHSPDVEFDTMQHDHALYEEMTFGRALINENTAQARSLCAIFDEMRTCCETSNFSHLPGLIEEAQHRAYCMESWLGTLHDFEYWYKESKRLRDECEALGLPRVTNVKATTG